MKCKQPLFRPQFSSISRAGNRSLFSHRSSNFKRLLVQPNESKTLKFYSTVNTKGRKLRPYQEECIKECIRSLDKGIKRQVVSLPVGSGKTEIFAHIIGLVPTPKEVPQAKKTLVLAHREELLDQAWKTIRRVQPNLIIDVDRADLNASPASADVVMYEVIFFTF